MFCNGQVDLTGRLSESITILVVNFRKNYDDKEEAPETFLRGGARLHDNGDHHHLQDLLRSDHEELLVTTAFISAISVKKFDTAVIETIQVATRLDTEYIEVFKKLEHQGGVNRLAPYMISKELFSRKKRMTRPNNKANPGKRT